MISAEYPPSSTLQWLCQYLFLSSPLWVPTQI